MTVAPRAGRAPAGRASSLTTMQARSSSSSGSSRTPSRAGPTGPAAAGLPGPPRWWACSTTSEAGAGLASATAPASRANRAGQPPAAGGSPAGPVSRSQPKPGWWRWTAATSERRKVPGSRSSGPSRTQITGRPCRCRASNSPSLSRYPGGATKEVRPPRAARSKVQCRAAAAGATGAADLAMNAIFPPAVAPRSGHCSPPGQAGRVTAVTGSRCRRSPPAGPG